MQSIFLLSLMMLTRIWAEDFNCLPYKNQTSTSNDLLKMQGELERYHHRIDPENVINLKTRLSSQYDLKSIKVEAFFPFLAYTHGLYLQMNKALYTQDKSAQNSLHYSLKVMCTTYYQLPPVEAFVFRGQKDFQGQTYLEKSLIKELKWVSTSEERGIVEKFGSKVVLKILSKTARNISNWSKSPTEKEVIFAPYTYFWVHSNEIIDQHYQILLEEVIPHFVTYQLKSNIRNIMSLQKKLIQKCYTPMKKCHAICNGDQNQITCKTFTTEL